MTALGLWFLTNKQKLLSMFSDSGAASKKAEDAIQVQRDEDGIVVIQIREDYSSASELGDTAMDTILRAAKYLDSNMPTKTKAAEVAQP